MSIEKTHCRLNRALRLAHSAEAQDVLAAAREILATRIRHGDVLSSPGAVRDYLQLVLHDREYEVFVVVLPDAQNRVLTSEEMLRGKHPGQPAPCMLGVCINLIAMDTRQCSPIM